VYWFQSYIKDVYGWDILRPSHWVDEVECLHSTDAENSGHPDKHFNRPHKVLFSRFGLSGSIACQVVVPRLGLDKSTLQSEREAVELQHVLPYWLPDWKPLKPLP
jgi:hypothetical protein